MLASIIFLPENDDKEIHVLELNRNELEGRRELVVVINMARLVAEQTIDNDIRKNLEIRARDRRQGIGRLLGEFGAAKIGSGWLVSRGGPSHAATEDTTYTRGRPAVGLSDEGDLYVMNHSAVKSRGRGYIGITDTPQPVSGDSEFSVVNENGVAVRTDEAILQRVGDITKALQTFIITHSLDQ